MRATFIHNRFKSTEYDINICSLLRNIFADEPSGTETTICKQCNTDDKNTWPMLAVNNDVFKNKLSNLESAIVDNFPSEISECSQCQTAVEFSRDFGQHIFVEISSGSYTTNASDYEPRFKHKFGDIPVTLFNNQYVLHAAFLYKYGTHDNDIGHYTVCNQIE